MCIILLLDRPTLIHNYSDCSTSILTIINICAPVFPIKLRRSRSTFVNS